MLKRLHGLVVAIGLIPMAASATEPALKAFGDWQVGCDNVQHCAALSLPPEADGTIAYLRLDRVAGPDAPVELVLRLLGDWTAASMPVQLALDGDPFPVRNQAVRTGAENGTLSLTFQPVEVEAFIKGARKAKQLSITAPGVTANVSLGGAVAAMLWLDERQGRLDTTSALIRKGNATNVPAAFALPVLTARAAGGALPEEDAKALTAALRAQFKQQEDDTCEDDETLAATDAAWALDGNRRLIGLGCSTGAYNLMTGFWFVDGDDVAAATPVAFPQGEGEAADNMVINAEFDPKTGRLDFFSRGRGVGDCGSTGSYAWTGDAFVRTGFSMMGECRGIGVDDWIPLYRSMVK